MAKKIELEFELKYKEAEKNLDEFQKEYAKLEKEVQSANKKTEDALKILAWHILFEIHLSFLQLLCILTQIQVLFFSPYYICFCLLNSF